MRIAWFASLLVFLVGCAPLSNGVREGWFSTDSKKSRETKSQSEASYNFLLGELALKERNYDRALEYYRKSLESDPGNAVGVRKRIVEISLRNGNVEDALLEIQKIGPAVESDAELLRLKAGMLATQKKFNEAIEVYKKLQSFSPALDEETNIFLASLYAQKGDFLSAKKVIEEVLKSQPQSVFAKYYMAKILLGLNDLKNSEKYFKQVLPVVPLIESAYLDLARLYVYQKRVPEAITTLELLIRRSPGNKAARSLLGELLLGEERIKDAIAEFEALEKIQDDPSDTRIRIAALKLQQRDFVGAEVDLKLVLLNNPKNATARYYLANAYAGQKRINKALKQVSKISAQDQYFFESRMLAIFFLKQERRPAEAVDFLDQLIAQKGDDQKLLLLKSNLLKDSGDLDGAIELMEKLVATNPKDDGHLFTLAVLHDEAGNKDEAVKLLNKCIKLNPDNANALNYLGYTYADRGQKLDQAKKWIEQALALEPDNGYFLDSLGWVYYKLKDYKSAKEQMEKAVTIVPDDAVILEHMGIVYSALGDKAAAAITWNKALEVAPDSDDIKVEGRLRELIDSLSDE